MQEGYSNHFVCVYVCVCPLFSGYTVDLHCTSRARTPSKAQFESFQLTDFAKMFLLEVMTFFYVGYLGG